MSTNENLAGIERDAKTLITSAKQIKYKDKQLEELLAIFEKNEGGKMLDLFCDGLS